MTVRLLFGYFGAQNYRSVRIWSQTKKKGDEVMVSTKRKSQERESLDVALESLRSAVLLLADSIEDSDFLYGYGTSGRFYFDRFDFWMLYSRVATISAMLLCMRLSARQRILVKQHVTEIARSDEYARILRCLSLNIHSDWPDLVLPKLIYEFS
jgi:hypothetical protein